MKKNVFEKKSEFKCDRILKVTFGYAGIISENVISKYTQEV